jgi:hypothetical protein
MINIVLAVLLMLAAGCASSSYIITGRARPTISAELVKVYAAAPTNSEVIGTVSVTNPSGFSHYLNHPETEMLKKEAAQLGANGIIIGADSAQIIVGYQVSAVAIFVP